MVWMVVAIKMRWDLLLTGQVPLMDFDIYYQTARDVMAGQHPLSLPYMQTGGPPSVILPFIPFSFLPLTVARAVMTWVSLLAIVITAYVMAKTCFKKEVFLATIILASVWLMAFPSRFNLGQGQPNLLVMLLAALVLTSKGALAAALMAVVKTNYLVVFASFSPKKLMSSILMFMVFVGLGFGVIKPSYYADFVRERGGATISYGAEIIDVDYYNQSLKSTLSRFGVEKIYAPVFWVLAVGSGIYLFRSKNIAAGILLSLLLSPILWQHYVVVAYPVVVGLFKKRPWMSALGMGLISMELPWVHGQALTLINSLPASHYFMGLWLLLAAAVMVGREKTSSG